MILRVAGVSFFRQIFTVLLCITPLLSYAQEISGKITNQASEPLVGVTISVREKEKTAIVYFDTSDQHGNYNISLDKPFSQLVIEFRSLGFKRRSIDIVNLVKGSSRIIDITLESAISSLEEVTILSKKKPVIVKKDTIVYNIEAFKDGTEEVIEDIIKKLPGITLNTEGKIFFKGKAIKGVLLDGDDLFDNNYQIGTKNIDVDLIDGISAIEKYVKNPLLKGVINSEDVALNLSIKKGEFDFSNDTDIGVGIENRFNFKSNLLGISKAYKSFTTSSFNNIGREYSPYEYFTPTDAELNSSGSDFISRNKIISERLFSSDIGNERVRINNNFFTSTNAIIKVSEKLESKINIDFKKDRLRRTTNEIIDFLFNDSLSSINHEENFTKKPTFFKAQVDVNYKLSKSSLIESSTIFSDATIRENSNSVTNGFTQKSVVTSEESKFQQQLRYTKKIDQGTAFLSTLTTELFRMPQRLSITPEIRFDSINGSLQQVYYNSFYLEQANALITNATSKNVKVSAGFTMNASTLESSLEETGQPSASVSSNDIDYTYYFPWLEANYFQKLGKWRFKGDLKLWYLTNQIRNTPNATEQTKTSHAIVTPKIRLSYHFNRKSSMQWSGKYDVRPITIDRLFTNPIFTTSNASFLNTSELETLKNYATSLEFKYIDFLNLFQLRSGVSFSYKPNNFLANIEIDEFLFSTIKQLQDVSFTSLSFNTHVDTYIDILKSNLRVNTLYGISTYSNFINASDLRTNTSYNSMVDLNLKTGFLGIVNFEMSSQFANTIFTSKGIRSVSNSSFRHSFKTYISPFKGLQLVTSVDYVRPNLKRQENFIFFETSLTYKPEKGKISYSLISNNITSQPSLFQTTNVSDFSSSVNSYTIVEPYLLFSVTFKL